MKKVIIGHRGVGKTSFLKRHENYFKQAGLRVPHFDLDRQVELSEDDTVSNIFKNKGEAYFRECELNVFKKLTNENSDYVISLGAGFNISRISSENEVLLISRITDKEGRIFLNRPRLNTEVSALDEYKEKYLQRHESFLDKATSLYSMPEGITQENEIEKKIVTGDFCIEDAFYTLTEKEISNLESLKAKYKNIELRTDLIPLEKINQIVESHPKHHWLISVRKNERITEFKNARYDFDIKIHERPSFFLKNSENIISCHTDNIDEALQQVRNIDEFHIKLSPAVEDFSDLIKGFQWQQQDSKNRSFLPRSKNGKWIWFRQLAKYYQQINFIRNFTFMKDQPSKYQWLLLPSKKPKQFAAVLGQPVLFSRSPELHRNFFSAKHSFFTAIEIGESELSEHLSWLQSLGLSYAAVTSPLKKVAYSMSNQRSKEVEQFQSANTLYLKDNKIISHNTDVFGFKYLTEQIEITNADRVVVWGGGGTLAIMQSILPSASYMSSQTGESRDSNVNEIENPTVVVWAAPRTNNTKWPLAKWTPKLVVDLNYVENSMGLEYAQKNNLSYCSGLVMFEQQGAEQQKFWKSCD